MFNLKVFRETKLKMKIETLSNILGISKEALERYEQKKDKVPMSIILKLSEVTGMEYEDILNYKPKSKALIVNDNWKKNREVTKELLKLVTDELSIGSEKYSEKVEVECLNQLKNSVSLYINKPRVAVMGMSDAGKSSFINSIIGLEKMPVSWTPTTAITVYLKHIDDKPSFINDETVIFKIKDNSDSYIDIRRISEKEYFDNFILASGDASMLSAYGIRQGEKCDTNEAGSAIIYIDSPLLKVCDILDLPGFGTGDSETDDAFSNIAQKEMDILIYMSPSNGFLRGNDIEFLKSAVKNLPVLKTDSNSLLSNLFIIASQSHIIGNTEALNNILDKGASRLYSGISDLGYSEINLRKRFFTYTKDIDHLRSNFENEFTIFIESLPKIILDDSLKKIGASCEEYNSNINASINELNSIKEVSVKKKKVLESLVLDREKINKQNKTKRNFIIEAIKNYRKQSKDDLLKDFNDIFTVDEIVKIIEAKGYTKSKDDIESLGGCINSLLEFKLEKNLKDKSSILAEEIDKYIESFAIEIDTMLSGTDINLSFNAKRIFASALTGTVTLGALAIWASTLGNLGGYILVTKGVSLLSLMGISVAGGTASAVSLVSALGGPITLGIALAVISALSIFSIFTGGWKEAIAKKIINQYKEEKVIEKLNGVIDNFWDETLTGFNTAADTLETEYVNKIVELSNDLSNFNERENIYNIARLENIKVFLANVIRLIEKCSSSI